MEFLAPEKTTGNRRKDASTPRAKSGQQSSRGGTDLTENLLGNMYVAMGEEPDSSIGVEMKMSGDDEDVPLHTHAFWERAEFGFEKVQEDTNCERRHVEILTIPMRGCRRRS